MANLLSQGHWLLLSHQCNPSVFVIYLRLMLFDMSQCKITIFISPIDRQYHAKCPHFIQFITKDSAFKNMFFFLHIRPQHNYIQHFVYHFVYYIIIGVKWNFILHHFSSPQIRMYLYIPIPHWKQIKTRVKMLRLRYNVYVLVAAHASNRILLHMAGI